MIVNDVSCWQKTMPFGVVTLNCLVLLVKLAAELSVKTGSAMLRLAECTKRQRQKISQQFEIDVSVLLTLYHIQLCYVNYLFL